MKKMLVKYVLVIKVRTIYRIYVNSYLVNIITLHYGTCHLVPNKL